MGIVIRQSAKNLIFTYLGFVIGAVNTLFLFTKFLSPEYYGLVGYLLSSANIMMPFLAFGVQNTIVKFYTRYEEEGNASGFLKFALWLPLLVCIPLGLLGVVAYEQITHWLSSRNDIIAPYVWTIYVIAVAMAYFEVFYAIARVKLRTVYGNFLKEVFHRMATSVLLLLVFLGWLSPEGFVYGTVGMYVLRTLMMLTAFGDVRLKGGSWPSKLQRVELLSYSSVIILAGSVAALLLDIDKVMLGKYEDIGKIAYYNVAVYIAMVVAVPARAMHQVTYPITAALMNKGDYAEVNALNRKSSLNLMVVSALIFLLIVTNTVKMYELLPPDYADGLLVVLLISVAKLIDNSIGITNAVIFNSDHYRMVLFFGVILSVLTISLNAIGIPLFGMYGAAAATLLAFVIYNFLKVYFVYRHYGVQPYSMESLKVLALTLVCFGIFYFWDFPWHPVLAIGLKSVILSVFFLMICLRTAISPEINQLVYTLQKNIREGLSRIFKKG